MLSQTFVKRVTFNTYSSINQGSVWKDENHINIHPTVLKISSNDKLTISRSRNLVFYHVSEDIFMSPKYCRPICIILGTNLYMSFCYPVYIPGVDYFSINTCRVPRVGRDEGNLFFNV